MYDFDNIKSFNNVSKINSNSINSQHTVDFLKNHKSLFFLNTGKEILKEVFKINKTFFHIHPGYLPKVKGADGSLHSIDKFNEVGCSLFEMTKKIDDGKVLRRFKRNFDQFELKNINSFKTKDLYRIWFSFFDPALRAFLFKETIEGYLNLKNKSLYKKYDKETPNYWSFMNDIQLKKTFSKKFLNN